MTFCIILGHGDITSEKLEDSHSHRDAVFGSSYKVLCKLYVFDPGRVFIMELSPYFVHRLLARG